MAMSQCTTSGCFAIGFSLICQLGGFESLASPLGAIGKARTGMSMDHSRAAGGCRRDWKGKAHDRAANYVLRAGSVACVRWVARWGKAGWVPQKTWAWWSTIFLHRNTNLAPLLYPSASTPSAFRCITSLSGGLVIFNNASGIS